MRSTNKEITTQSLITVTQTATTEDIISISENKDLLTIVVEVRYFLDNDTLGNEFYEISGETYEMLMSESPEFAQGKPKNEYRESDLWHVIDLIRSR